jgi:hypothetical protein
MVLTMMRDTASTLVLAAFPALAMAVVVQAVLVVEIKKKMLLV